MTCIKDSVCMPIFGWTRDQGNGLKENEFSLQSLIIRIKFSPEHRPTWFNSIDLQFWYVFRYWLPIRTLKSHSLAICLQTCGLFRYVCAWPFHTLFSTFLFLYHLPFTQFSGYLDPNPIQLFAKYIVCVVSV